MWHFSKSGMILIPEDKWSDINIIGIGIGMAGMGEWPKGPS